MGRVIRSVPCAIVGGWAAYRLVVKPWSERWGSTADERRAALPGDELIKDASQVTRAITIAAPPEDVWPWVIQIGADRGGFYSYEVLENLFGLGIHNADRIAPAWQHRAVGDLVAADARGRGGWYVMEVQPGRALVLQIADLGTKRPTRTDAPPYWTFSWAFVVQRVNGETSRLLVRERVAFGKRWIERVLSPTGLVSFVMTQKMMRGIRTRAEAARADGVLGKTEGRALAG